MSQKYTVEEVRKSADWLYQWERKAGARNARAMLTAYADSIERAQAGVTGEVVERAFAAMDATFRREYPARLDEAKKSLALEGVRAALLAVWPSVPAQAVPVAQLRLRLDRWDVVGIHGEIEKLHLPTGEYPLFTHPPAQPADSGRSYATSWTDEEKARAFEWLRAAATADGAPIEAGVALDTWHALTAQGQSPASPAGVPDGWRETFVELLEDYAGARAETAVWNVTQRVQPEGGVRMPRPRLAKLMAHIDLLAAAPSAPEGDA